jgi:hypothetical protein
MIELAFKAVLSSSPAIAALCGKRIYPLLLPTNSPMPAIDYSFVGGSATATLTTTGVQKYRVEVNCWGDTYTDAVTLRAAVVLALNGYTDFEFDGSDISIQLIQPRDFFDHDLLQYRAMVEFYVFATL